MQTLSSEKFGNYLKKNLEENLCNLEIQRDRECRNYCNSDGHQC